MYWYNHFKKTTKTYLKEVLKKEPKNDANQYLDIGIIDPSIGTSNIGDHIIYESVIKELRKQYPNDCFTNFPSQFSTSYDAKRLMAEKNFLFVSGTNLLSSNIDIKDQWKLDPLHRLFLNDKIILMGVGWWQYQEEPNRYTKKLYRSIFNTKYLHAVRDSYTCQMLKSIGIENVVNTSCLTLWNVTKRFCAQIPIEKSPNVVTTLTHYHKNSELDKRMLEILSENYDNVYLWAQAFNDINYYKTLSLREKNIEIVAPNLGAYDKILEDTTVEYIGTRLHGGIRALKKGCRTLIVAVDNRAFEIGRDTNLNVIKRENIDESLNFINNIYHTEINIPLDNINKWRSNLPKSN